MCAVVLFSCVAVSRDVIIHIEREGTELYFNKCDNISSFAVNKSVQRLNKVFTIFVLLL